MSVAGESGPVEVGDAVMRPEVIRVSADPAVPEVVAATWGQVAIRQALANIGDDDDRVFRIRLTVPVPSAVSPARIVECLTWLIRRHEALRTLLQQTQSGLRQRILSTTDVSVCWVDAPAESVDEVAQATSAQLMTQRFAPDIEVPLRFAVVSVGGDPVLVIIVLLHTIADLQGGNVLVAEFEDALAGRPFADFPAAPQPRDIVAVEQGESGRDLSARAVDYWVRTMAQAPLMRLDPRLGESQQPPFWRGELFSALLAPALSRLSRRTGASTTAVLLAAVAQVLAELTGTRRTTIMVIASNRFRQPYRSCVGTVNLEGLLRVDVQDAGFTELVRRTWRASILAYRHSQYDKRVLSRALTEQVPAAASANRRYWFNDVRTAGSAEPTGSPGADQPMFRWAGKFHAASDDTALSFLVYSQADAIAISLAADTRALAPCNVEKTLRRIHAVIVEAVNEEYDG